MSCYIFTRPFYNAKVLTCTLAKGSCIIFCQLCRYSNEENSDTFHLTPSPRSSFARSPRKLLSASRGERGFERSSRTAPVNVVIKRYARADFTPGCLKNSPSSFAIPFRNIRNRESADDTPGRRALHPPTTRSQFYSLSRQKTGGQLSSREDI